MTKIDFYVLDKETRNGMLRFVCQLTEKIYALGHRVHLHTANQQTARHLDQLLWTYSALAFLPHRLLDADSPADAIASADTSANPPITIGYVGEFSDPQHCEDVLINVSAEVPLWFSRFSRVTEFVAGDEDDRLTARERYRFYRDRGYNLDMHQIDPK